MSHTVFSELRFWLMIVISIVLPVGLYTFLMVKRAISQPTTLLLGFALVAIAGLDIYFLQILSTAAKLTPSLADDAVFLSEISLALYLIPAMFGGIGVNVISHVLVRHLDDANKRFNREHPNHINPGQIPVWSASDPVTRASAIGSPPPIVRSETEKL